MNCVTPTEAWDFYMKNKGNGLAGRKSDESRWRDHVGPYVGEISFPDMRAVDILNWRRKLESKGLSPQTVKHCMALLRRVVRFASKWDYYTGPVPHFELPTVHNTRTRILSPGEAEVLLNELSRRSILWHDICLFALNTGLRANEIFSLRKFDISSNLDFVYIINQRPGISKTVSRALPLNHTAQEVVQCLLHTGKGQTLFQYADGRPINAVSSSFWRAVKSCHLNTGVKDRLQRVVFHTLRHTFASRLVQRGVSLQVVCDLLGHKSLKTTMRYAKLDVSQTKAAVDLLDSTQ